jgi:hypothetical protein
MKNWIEKNINPPGMHRKNRGSLFSVIGTVFEMVKNDARTSFYAHFPYLSDLQKLKQHGKSLFIPEFPDDTEEDYRSRVATASFYLMRAGERGYCLEQLSTHFGDRYILIDEFLKVYVKILDLEDGDRAWVTGFLDGMLNPNIELTVAEWFNIVENVIIQESQQQGVTRNDIDIVGSGLCCDGRFYCDQGIDILCDGTRLCNDSWNCDYCEPVRGNIADSILAPSCLDGTFFCDGSVTCSGFLEIYDPRYFSGIPLFDNEEEVFETRMTLGRMADTAMIDAVCDGDLLCDGRNLDSMTDAPMTMRIIRPFLCNGNRTVYAQTLAESLFCDGSFTCDDQSWPCTDVLEEEVL